MKLPKWVKELGEKADIVKCNVKKLKEKADNVGANIQKKRAEKEMKEIEILDSELTKAKNRLKTLKTKEAVENKKEQIRKLERKLTTKGQILTTIEKGIKQVMKNKSPRKPRTRRHRRN